MIFKKLKNYSKYEVSEKGLVRNAANKSLLQYETSGYRVYDDLNERIYVTKEQFVALYNSASASPVEKKVIEAKVEVPVMEIEIDAPVSAEPVVAKVEKPKDEPKVAAPKVEKPKAAPKVVTAKAGAKKRLTPEEKQARTDMVNKAQKDNPGLSISDLSKKIGLDYTTVYDILVYFPRLAAQKKA